MPSPSVTADYVERLIALYEKKRDAAFTTVPDSRAKFVWIGGTPVVLPAKNGFRLCWSYMGELLYAEPESGADCRKADFVVSFLKKISAERFSDSSEAFSAAHPRKTGLLFCEVIQGTPTTASRSPSL